MLLRPLDWSLMVPARPPTPCKSTKSRLPDAEITKGRRSLHLHSHIQSRRDGPERNTPVVGNNTFSWRRVYQKLQKCSINLNILSISVLFSRGRLEDSIQDIPSRTKEEIKVVELLLLLLVCPSVHLLGSLLLLLLHRISDFDNAL